MKALLRFLVHVVFLAAWGANAHAELPEASIARLWRSGDVGTPLQIRARVVNERGQPVAGAAIRLWQADGTGSYQPDRYRAELSSAERGEFGIISVLPGQYYGAKHIHLVISHADYVALHTRILFRGDPYIDAGEEDFAIALEEVNKDDQQLLVGNVEFVLRAGN